MKKMKSLIGLSLIAATLSMTACQKDTTPQQTTVTKEKLTGTYKVTAMKFKATTGAEEDMYAPLPDCQKQSTQALNADLSYRLNDACNPTDNQTSTWAYVDAKRVVINGMLCNIASFDGRQLVLSFDNFLGMPGTLIETLTKQ